MANAQRSEIPQPPPLPPPGILHPEQHYRTGKTQHLPSVQTNRPNSIEYPKMLPIIDEPIEQQQNSPMAQHIQYNSPLAIYSQSSAAESYRQQTGNIHNITGNATGFDSARSKTLQLLKEQEQQQQQQQQQAALIPHSARFDEPSKTDLCPQYHGYVDPYRQSPTFHRLQCATETEPKRQAPNGSHPVPVLCQSDRDHPVHREFFEKVAAAERPNVPAKVTPSWTSTARNRQNRWESQTNNVDPIFNRRIELCDSKNQQNQFEQSPTRVQKFDQSVRSEQEFYQSESRQQPYQPSKKQYQFDYAPMKQQNYQAPMKQQEFRIPIKQQQQFAQWRNVNQLQQQANQSSAKQQSYQQVPYQFDQGSPPRQRSMPPPNSTTVQCHSPGQPSYYFDADEQQYQQWLKHRENEARTRRQSRTPPPSVKGYEFGGLDFRQNMPLSSCDNRPWPVLTNHKHSPVKGFQMGGMNFDRGTKGHDQLHYGSYHGYGPSSPRQRANNPLPMECIKSQEPPSRHDRDHWLRTCVAHNVDTIRPGVDNFPVLSNQHLHRQKTQSTNVGRSDDGAVGTWFSGPEGFKIDHRKRDVRIDTNQPPTFSISAPKSPENRPFPVVRREREMMFARRKSEEPNFERYDISGYTSEAVVRGRNPISRTYSKSGTNIRYPLETKSVARKQVNISSLISGDAEKPGPVESANPQWARKAEQKHNSWDRHRIDPLYIRPKDPTDPMPTWAETARRKRNEWEAKATLTEAYRQLPASHKISPNPQPHWTKKAENTHTLWQTESDRLDRTNVGVDSVHYGTTSVPTTLGDGQMSQLNQRRMGHVTGDTPDRRQFGQKSVQSDQFVDQSNQRANSVNQSGQSSRFSSDQSAPSAKGGQFPPLDGNSNTKANTTGFYVDPRGQHVSYSREMVTRNDPGVGFSMLTEEQSKIGQESLQPGIVSKHVTTKYYKKSTITDSKTTTTTKMTDPENPSFQSRPGRIRPGITQF